MRPLNLFCLCALSFVLSSSIASAQLRDAGSKIRGDALSGHELQSAQRHAQERSQTLYYYSQSKEPLPKQEAKELVGGIKKDLTASDKALAKLKAEHAKEPDVLKQIALIEKHQARAHEVCGMAEEQCAKEHGDHVAICDCCTDMWNELDAAQVETQKLLKMLKIEKLPVPKKSTDTKSDAKKKTDK